MVRKSAPLLSMLLMLGSCGSGEDNSAPTGQVVAKVAGEEVTASELRLEMPPEGTDPVLAVQAQQQALEALIARKLLVAEAQQRKLGSSPLAALFEKRAKDLAMVQLLESSIANGVPEVSDDEVDQFISSHPASFAQRRLISVHQIVIPQISESVAKQLEPLETFEEVNQVLQRNDVSFFRSAAVMDSLNLDPAVAERIAQLGRGELLMSPTAPGTIVMSRIGTSHFEPLTGKEAQRAARLMLTKQRNTGQVRRALAEIVKNNRSKVQMNPAYVAGVKSAGASSTTAQPGAPAGN